MHRQLTYRVLLPAAVALVLIGCAQPAPHVDVSTGPVPQGISVTGTGEVTGAPDTMSVTFTVSVLADDVTTAVDDNARTTEQVIAAVRDAGVEQADIQTSAYNLAPDFDYTDDGRRPLGYKVTNSIDVTVRDPGRGGTVIDAAVAAGGDDVEVTNVGFGLDDDAEALDQARAAAFADARTKAEQFAALADRPLGPVVSIEESASSTPVPFDRAVTAGSDVAATPVQPGEVETSVTVTVRWSLG
jgi:uncharacterized protein YggE